MCLPLLADATFPCKCGFPDPANNCAVLCTSTPIRSPNESAPALLLAAVFSAFAFGVLATDDEDLAELTDDELVVDSSDARGLSFAIQSKHREYLRLICFDAGLLVLTDGFAVRALFPVDLVDIALSPVVEAHKLPFDRIVDDIPGRVLVLLEVLDLLAGFPASIPSGSSLRCFFVFFLRSDRGPVACRQSSRIPDESFLRLCNGVTLIFLRSSDGSSLTPSLKFCRCKCSFFFDNQSFFLLRLGLSC